MSADCDYISDQVTIKIDTKTYENLIIYMELTLNFLNYVDIKRKPYPYENYKTYAKKFLDILVHKNK